MIFWGAAQLCILAIVVFFSCQASPARSGATLYYLRDSSLRQQALRTDDTLRTNVGENSTTNTSTTGGITPGGDEGSGTGSKDGDNIKAKDDDDTESKDGDDSESKDDDKSGGGVQPKSGGGGETTIGDNKKSGNDTSSPKVSANATEPIAGNSTAQSNETSAFLQFTLNLIVELDESSSFKEVPIFKQGALTGDFENNPDTSDLVTVGTDYNDEKWFTAGPYLDRISFKMAYSQDSKDYAFTKPVVQVSTISGIDPSVEDFKTGDDAVGSFHILYSCKGTGPEKNLISLHVQITNEHSLDVTWSKTCGRGRNEHINFGFLRSDNKLTIFNEDGTYGITEAQTLEIGPLQQSTELSAQLTAPQWQLGFLTPHLESDNDMVRVALRGTISGGTLSTDAPTKFSILYHQCEQTSATAAIKFTFAIPPWNNITASWRKTCGGSHSKSLLIGTTGSNSFDVMQEGELNSKYNVTDSTSIENAFGMIHEVPENLDHKRFYLTNSDEESDIHIQTIVTTVMTDQDVVSASVEVPLGGSSSYIPRGGAVVVRRQTKSLLLHFVCKKKGQSLILVTLPIVKYKNVEFGFIKLCNEPHALHHSGFLQTAGSIMWTIMLLAVVGGIGGWVYIRRRPGVKYAPVPVSDIMP